MFTKVRKTDSSAVRPKMQIPSQRIPGICKFRAICACYGQSDIFGRRGHLVSGDSKYVRTEGLCLAPKVDPPTRTTTLTLRRSSVLGYCASLRINSRPAWMLLLLLLGKTPYVADADSAARDAVAWKKG